jgi:phosphate transport system permease protein
MKPRTIVANAGPTDRIFRGTARGSGVVVLAIMTAVGMFLAYRGWLALHVAGWKFLTTTQWEPDAHNFGIAAVLLGTVLIGVVAVLIAVPLATATALYVSEYAPRRAKRLLISRPPPGRSYRSAAPGPPGASRRSRCGPRTSGSTA